MTRRLGLGGDDRYALADQEVHQGGLPYVGVAHDIDEARAVRDFLLVFHRPECGGIGIKDLARPLPVKGRVAGKVYRVGRLVLGIVSPLDVDCTPGEACAEGREDEVVTLLELLLEFPDAEGDRSRAGVASVLDVDHHAIHGYLHLTRYSVDDAEVSLVGDYPSDVVIAEPVALHDGAAAGGHALDSLLEDGSTLLVDVVLTAINRLVGGRASRATRLHDEVGAARTIRAEVRVEHTFVLLSRLEEYASSAVAEERARSAVGVVGDGGHLLSGKHDDALVAARSDVVSSSFESVDEAGASSLHVEGKGVDTARLEGYDRSRRGEVVVSRIRSHDDPVDGGGVDVVAGEEVLDGFDAEEGSTLRGILEDATLADPDAGHDPLVVGIDHLLEVGIGYLIFREIPSDSRDGCVDDTHRLVGYTDVD